MSGSSRRIRLAGTGGLMKVSAARDAGPKLPRAFRKNAKIDKRIARIRVQTALLVRFGQSDPSLSSDDLKSLYDMTVVRIRRRGHDGNDLLRSIERAELIMFLNRTRSDRTGFAQPEIERFRSLAERYLTGDMKLLNEIDALPVKA